MTPKISMTPNESLEITHQIQDLMRQNLLQCIEPLFPKDVVRIYEQEKGDKDSRDRVYTMENTLLTIVVTFIQEDKSLQNSVHIFQEIFKKNNEAIFKQEQERIEILRKEKQNQEPRLGRPYKMEVKLPLSKTKEVSSNTAAYSKARKRIELSLIEATYEVTKEYSEMARVKKWYGRTVYNTDGTYFQMQDTKLIPEKYRAQKNKDGQLQGYPQGLLQVMTQQGSGLIAAYKIAGRTESELHIAPELVKKLPPGSLVLADDLYSCYSFLAFMIEHGYDIIVPDKKDKRYRVLQEMGMGDQIIVISKPFSINPLYPGQKLPEKLVIRRISYRDTQDSEKVHFVLTTLEKSIPALEIVIKYSSRWDIEISIREIKTLMGMNIARGKSEEMVFKEIGVQLIGYNILRRMVTESVKETDFSPQTDIFQKLFAPYKNILVDRKGRVYSRWAPGRPTDNHKKNKESSDSSQTRPSLSTKNKGGKISKI